MARPKNYLYELMPLLKTERPIRLVVGSPAAQYLERYRNQTSINIVETEPTEWARFEASSVWHRAIWNYWRCLTLGASTPGRDGLVIFEDDVLPTEEWERQLQDTIQEIEREWSEKYALALLHLLCPSGQVQRSSIRLVRPEIVLRDSGDVPSRAGSC